MVVQSAPARLALAGLAAALALVSGPALAAPAAGEVTPPAAAARPTSAPITLSLRDVPLRTALETLFNGTGLQHAVEPAVPNYPITLDIRDVPFDTALRTLLRLAPGVTYRKEGDIYVIGMRQAPAEQPATEEVQPPEETNAAPEYQYEKVPLNFAQYQVMAYVLGGIPIPDEATISAGSGGLGGGIGGGIGGYSGGGIGGIGGGGIGGFGGGSLGGFGGGLGGGIGGGLGGGIGGFGGGGVGGFGGGGIGGFGGGGIGGYGGGGIGGFGGGGIGGGTGYVGPQFRRF